ncbi:MAG: PKD domain-containing protein [Candidatus Thermoplasmatota archaeon]
MKIDLKNKYHIILILTVSVIGFMSAMVLLSPYTQSPEQRDADKDTIPDAVDNCPTVPNSDQSDVDSDGLGDVCDTCTDTDGDGYGDPGYGPNTCPVDNCPDVANANQTDRDQDRIGDACDDCPDDPLNDEDDDGICGGVDNCPEVYNPAQTDSDADGIGDACETPPQADFSLSPREPIAGELIQFTDTTAVGGGRLQQWQWSFGDNSTAEAQHPTHQYHTIGTYPVQLNVTDSNGKTSHLTKQVTVIPNDPPTIPTITGPRFGRTKTPSAYALTATDPDGNQVFYVIDWGDHINREPLGPYSSGVEVPVNHSWNTPGTFQITVTAKDTHNVQGNTASFLVRMTDLYLLDPSFIAYFEVTPHFLLYPLLFP